ncbi:MAG: hypothetical protein ACRDZ4_07045 [Egibacteraceae bacterium]
MSLQTSVRPARHARPTHRVHRVHPGPRARRARRLTIHQLCRTAERLGLITRQPRMATVRSPSSRPHPSSSRVLRAQVRNAVRLVRTPGPVYFVAAMLAGVAAAFLAGLWLY